MRLIILTTLCVLFLAGCGSVASESIQGATPNPTVIARGIEVYRQNYCGVCHTLDAASTRGTFGPSHNQMGIVAQQRIASASYGGAATTPEDYLRESILQPERSIVENYVTTAHAIPAYTHLAAADVEALVAMLLHQR